MGKLSEKLFTHLSPEYKEKIERMAWKEGLSKSTIIRMIIMRFFASNAELVEGIFNDGKRD